MACLVFWICLSDLDDTESMNRLASVRSRKEGFDDGSMGL